MSSVEDMDVVDICGENERGEIMEDSGTTTTTCNTTINAVVQEEVSNVRSRTKEGAEEEEEEKGNEEEKANVKGGEDVDMEDVEQGAAVVDVAASAAQNEEDNGDNDNDKKDGEGMNTETKSRDLDGKQEQLKTKSADGGGDAKLNTESLIEATMAEKELKAVTKGEVKEGEAAEEEEEKDMTKEEEEEEEGKPVAISLKGKESEGKAKAPEEGGAEAEEKSKQHEEEEEAMQSEVTAATETETTRSVEKDKAKENESKMGHAEKSKAETKAETTVEEVEHEKEEEDLRRTSTPPPTPGPGPGTIASAEAVSVDTDTPSKESFELAKATTESAGKVVAAASVILEAVKATSAGSQPKCTASAGTSAAAAEPEPKPEPEPVVVAAVETMAAAAAIDAMAMAFVPPPESAGPKMEGEDDPTSSSCPAEVATAGGDAHDKSRSATANTKSTTETRASPPSPTVESGTDGFGVKKIAAEMEVGVQEMGASREKLSTSASTVSGRDNTATAMPTAMSTSDQEDDNEQDDDDNNDDDAIAKARATGQSLFSNALLSDLESRHAVLRQERDELLSTSEDQRGQILEMTRTVQDLRKRLQDGETLIIGKSREADVEKATRLAAENAQKLECERADRMAIECDALREEISRLSSANSALSKQLTKIETDAKLSTSSATPLRFELERTKKEVDTLSSHSKWLEQEYSSKSEELIQVRYDKSEQLSKLRSALHEANGRADIAETKLSSFEGRNKQLLNEITRLSQNVSSREKENADLIHSSQEELDAERKVSRLQQARVEELDIELKNSRNEIDALKRLAKDAADEAAAKMEQVIQHNEDELERVKGEMSKDVEKLEEELKLAKEKKHNAEKELNVVMRRQRRRRSSSSRGGGSGDIMGSPQTSSALVASQAGSDDDDDDDAHDDSESSTPMSLTDLLDKLADTEDELNAERKRRRSAELFCQRIQHEIESKTPIMRNQRREYERAIKGQQDALARLSESNATVEAHRKHIDNMQDEVRTLRYDMKEMKCENEDLARQVQTLLKNRISGNGSGGEGVGPTAGTDSSSSMMDIVEFTSVEEMQCQNQRLVKEHRRLQGKVTELERLLDEDELRQALQTAEKEVEELRKERERQMKLVSGIVKQRDLYRLLVAKNDDAGLGTTVGGDEVEVGAASGDVAFVTDGRALKTNKQENSSLALMDEAKKLRSDFREAENENRILQERLNRLDLHAGNLSESIDKLRSDLLSSSSENAKNMAQVRYLEHCNKSLQESLDNAKEETSRVLKTRKETQDINRELELSIEKLRVDFAKDREQLRQTEAKLRLAEASNETSKQSERRLAAEVESLRLDMSRQGTLVESIRRIEAGLDARNAQENEEQKAQLERLNETLTTERSHHTSEMEKSQLKINEFNDKVTSLEREKTDLLTDATNAKKESLAEQEKVQKLQNTCHSLQERLNEVESELKNKRSIVSATDKEKLDRIATLTTELESSKEELETFKERVDIYQQVAKTNESALDELKRVSETFKKEKDDKLQQVKHELETTKKLAEAKQVALDELGEELANHREKQDAKVATLNDKIDSLSSELDNANKNAAIASSKLESFMLDMETHKSNATSAQQNYERELTLHSSARSDLRTARAEIEKQLVSRRQVEGELSAIKVELEGTKKHLEAERKRIESIVKEEEEKLKCAREQNEILHRQMEAMVKSVEQLQGEKVKAAVSMGGEGEKEPTPEFGGAATGDGDGDGGSEIESSRKTVKELREIVRFMRSEREMLDAKLDVMKRTLERERTTAAITKRSLDEARGELQILQKNFGEREVEHDREKEKAKKDAADEQQVTLLRESNMLLREETEQIRLKLSAAEKKLDEAKSSLEPTNRQIRTLEVDKVTLEAEKESLTRELDAWKGRVQSLVSKFHPIDPEEHKNAVASVKEMKKDMELLRSDKDRTNQDNTSLKALVARLNKDIAQHKSKLEAITQSLAKVKSEKDALLKSTSDEKSTSVQELDHFRALAKERESKIASMKTELQSSQTRVENFTKMLRQYKAVVEDLKKKNQQSNAAEKDAQQAQKEGEKKMLELETLVKELRASLAEVAEQKQKRKQQEQKIQSAQPGPTSVSTAVSTAARDHPPSAAVTSETVSEVESTTKVATTAETSTVGAEAREKSAALVPEVPAGGFKFAPSKPYQATAISLSSSGQIAGTGTGAASASTSAAAPAPAPASASASAAALASASASASASLDHISSGEGEKVDVVVSEVVGNTALKSKSVEATNIAVAESEDGHNAGIGTTADSVCVPSTTTGVDSVKPSSQPTGLSTISSAAASAPTSVPADSSETQVAGGKTTAAPTVAMRKRGSENSLRLKLMEKKRLLAARMKEREKAASAGTVQPSSSKSTGGSSTTGELSSSKSEHTPSGGLGADDDAQKVSESPGVVATAASSSVETVDKDDVARTPITAVDLMAKKNSGTIGSNAKAPSSSSTSTLFGSRGTAAPVPLGSVSAGSTFGSGGTGSGSGALAFGAGSSNKPLVAETKSDASSKTPGGSGDAGGGSGLLNLAPPGSKASTPLTFGSSASIKLPLPSKKITSIPSSSPFAAFGNAAAGVSSGAASPFATALSGAKPLFGESKKRPLSDSEGGCSTKHARVGDATQDGGCAESSQEDSIKQSKGDNTHEILDV